MRNGHSKRPERREYTIMVVPHRGSDKTFSLRIPMNTIKVAAIALGCFLAIGIASFAHYQTTIHSANEERQELTVLRANREQQEQKIAQLAKATAEVQQEMSQLNQLEGDVRRALNAEDTSETSRSGVRRAGEEHYDGKGGPVVQTVDQLLQQTAALKQEIQAREERLAGMRDDLTVRNERVAATPSIWPANGDVTSRFGGRQSPFGYGSDWHPGIDIANSSGSPIVATADGVVTSAGWNGGYGLFVEIEHGNGISTAYGHSSQLAVQAGQTVKKGDVIAYMGSTGASTGPHVHYEVRVNGRQVNPADFL